MKTARVETNRVIAHAAGRYMSGTFVSMTGVRMRPYPRTTEAMGSPVILTQGGLDSSPSGILLFGWLRGCPHTDPSTMTNTRICTRSSQGPKPSRSSIRCRASICTSVWLPIAACTYCTNGLTPRGGSSGPSLSNRRQETACRSPP